MREIKFRGVSVRDGDWYYGDLVQSNNKYYIYCSKKPDFDYYDYRETGHLMEEVITETVGQFTGLEDVNGTKIYEGDILDCSNAWWSAAGPAGHDSPIIVVKWQDDLTGYNPFANYDCDCGVYISSDECKVIGNIYENEELLSKGGK